MWGVYRTDRYTVYSYRADWPLFIAVQPIAGGEVLWFENSSKYSVTTSRHRTQAHPLCPTTHLTIDKMVTLDHRGYRDFMAVRLNADPRQAEIEYFKGAVGEGAAVEFVEYLQISRKLGDTVDIPEGLA